METFLNVLPIILIAVVIIMVIWNYLSLRDLYTQIDTLKSVTVKSNSSGGN